MISFLKHRFHKFCYRIYMNGKNYHKHHFDYSIPGVSKLSNLKNLTLGENVSFGFEVLILGGGNVKIGNNTMIGAATIIHTSTHDYSTHPMNEIRIDKDVIIGNHVWIGTGVIINPGITIEDYSVIGSGSVVTKNVRKGDIVAGVPAKPLKKRDLKKLNLE